MTGTERKKTSFAGDVLKLVSGTAFAQLLAMLAAPLLTRLFSPGNWGVLAIFTSITGILGVIACMRYELSIMLPENDDEAANLLGVSLAITILISLLTMALIWWGETAILRCLNAPALAPYLWLVPGMVFINGVFLALNYWNSRTRHFGRLSVARVTSSVLATGGKLGFGYAGYTSAGTMIGAAVAGQAIATTVLGGQIWRDDRDIFLTSIRLHKMREGIVRHKKFPLLSSWSALMNAISAYLPALMLAPFFSSTAVGFFALGQRILGMPMSLIGGAIAQVFFPRAAEAKHDGTLHALVGNAFNKLLSLGVYFFLLIMVAGKDIFSVIFGSQWAEAGIYAQILAPWILFQFISSPISTLFSVLEMQGFGLFFNSILLTTRVASLLIGGLLNNIFISLTLFSISGAILYLGLCLFILIQSGTRMSTLVKHSTQTVVIAAIAILPVLISKGLGTRPIIFVGVACLSLLLYYSILYLHDKELQRLCARFLT